jgi:hypothetical protein
VVPAPVSGAHGSSCVGNSIGGAPRGYHFVGEPTAASEAPGEVDLFALATAPFAGTAVLRRQ